jgi:SAM-dependent methyltransferase
MISLEDIPQRHQADSSAFIGVSLKDYYSEKLSALRLSRVYDLAPPRVRRYLEAEIRFVMDQLSVGGFVLELGCGYGRVLERLAAKTNRIVGIDTSRESLFMARRTVRIDPRARLVAMDAADLGFHDNCFDLVICIQNGISAFKVDQERLLREALRVTRRAGSVLFSSYSEKFWPNRLNWFRIQAAHGLLGEIDEEATGNGVIVCKDGFRATTVGPQDFLALAQKIAVDAKITEVDESSIFCEFVNQPSRPAQ